MHMARVSKRSSWKILLGGLFSAVAAGAIASTEAEVQLKNPRLAVEAEAPLRLEEQRQETKSEMRAAGSIGDLFLLL